MEEEGIIIVSSGVSWLLDRLRRVAQDRLDDITLKVAEGVPLHEYGNFLGRRREAKRWVDFMISDVFEEFQQAEDNALEDDGLEEMPTDEDEHSYNVGGEDDG